MMSTPECLRQQCGHTPARLRECARALRWPGVPEGDAVHAAERAQHQHAEPERAAAQDAGLAREPGARLDHAGGAHPLQRRRHRCHQVLLLLLMEAAACLINLA